jgi:hypothetical protein
VKEKENHVQSNQVFAELVGAVDAKVIVEIKGTTTTFQAWNVLKRRFATISTADVVSFAQNMRSGEFRGRELPGYLEDIRRMHKDLNAAGDRPATTSSYKRC